MKLKVTSVILTFSALALFLMTATNKGTQNFRGLQSTEISGIPAPNADLPISIKINNVQNLVQAILAASTYTNSSFDVLTINSFNQGVSDEGVVYSGQVSVTNDQGVTLNALLNGLYNPADGKIVFSAQEIQVDTEGSNPDNSTNSTSEVPDNSTQVPDNSTEVPDNSTIIPDNSTNSTVENPTENPVNNNTNVVAVPEGFTQINDQDLANNQVAQSALAWGINNILRVGVSARKIPAWPVDYNLSNLYLAASRSNNRGVYYLFQTQWSNSKNWKINANYTVLVKAADASLSSYGYWYHTFGWPISAINATVPVVNNSTNVTNPNNSTNVDNNSTNPNNSTDVNNNSTNVDNNSTNSTNSTNVDNNSTNSTNSTNVGNNSTVVNNSTSGNNSTAANNTNPVVNSSNSSNSSNTSVPVVTPDGFTVINPALLSQNVQASQALIVGYNSLLKLILAQNGIPQTNTNYTLQNLSFAGVKSRAYGVRYQFTGRWVNEKNWRIDANLTVDYISYNKTLVLNGNQWRSGGYPRGSLTPPSNNANASNSTSNATNSTAPANNGTAIVVTPVANSTVVIAPADNSAAPVVNPAADANSPVVDASVAAVDANAGAPVGDANIPVADANANAGAR